MAINTSILKSYAPQARRDFIAAVKTRAARFGILDAGSATIQEQGEVAIINGQAYPRTVARQCRDLVSRIRHRGFDEVMEEVAYTWFNRFAAIRYMELHGYLDHGFRVLSHPAGEITPEIVQHAEKVDLPGLKADRVVELKLDGRRDEELYRLLLVAQCNALHAAMPFLFERINDETELLLPDNLLHSDSVIRQMVERVPEVDWQETEIIGWLYQFYISEKKDQVIGKVVKSEDIPAATQLFTPNWIVKYMVQNSLGAKWLATYPDSPIKAKMEYYIEPALQSPDILHDAEVETPTSLDPEKLTFLDPASGSGHILVEAYDLFKEIYLERGYRQRDIPRLILEKNLYGLDIDDRAAQLSGFALIMRARADDRRILSSERPVDLNVLSIKESNSLNEREIVDLFSGREGAFQLLPTDELLPDTISQPMLAMPAIVGEDGRVASEVLALFRDARTYGSLLKASPALVSQIGSLKRRIEGLEANNLIGSTLQQYLAAQFLPILRQMEILGAHYDIVAANPPYMGSKGMNGSLKAFAARNFPDSKSDLFAMFMERAIDFLGHRGLMAMVNMQSWMFLSSYEDLRRKVLTNHTLRSMAHLGERAFDSIGGAVVSTTTFVVGKEHRKGYRTAFVRLVDGRSEAEKAANLRLAIQSPSCGWFYRTSVDDLRRIPGSPLAYWLSGKMVALFTDEASIESVADARPGLQTSDNGRFLRQWQEVSFNRTDFAVGSRTAAKSSLARWFPYNKGGEFRRWYGNFEHFVNWEADGRELFQFATSLYGTPTRIIKNADYYFRGGVTWSDITTGTSSFRLVPPGMIFDATGHMAFFNDEQTELKYLALLNLKITEILSKTLNPTIHFHVGYFRALPGFNRASSDHIDVAKECVEIARADWNNYEVSWDFIELPLLSFRETGDPLAVAYDRLRAHWRAMVDRMKRLEEDNNRMFIDAYGLQDELSPDVMIEEITLTCNPAFRYGAKVSPDERETLLQADTIREVISYAVGCMLGRYSPDQGGLILANQGDALSDYLAKVPNPSFVADADNIIPMLDDNWFEDDATDRFLEFLKVTFGTEHFDENLAFVERAIGKDIRKFFKRDFFSDHLKRYKRRPIYWVFSSGKEKAFEAIVYMHRYNETTLARMRMNYVVPLQSQMANRIERLATELSGANLSSAERKRKDTQRAKLIKQLEELGRFEEELRHLADRRIRIDLDDGVKVNYGKFGSLLAEVKAVTGGTDD